MVDRCQVSEDAARKDAHDLSPLLRDGDTQFYTQFTAKYGFQKEGACALQAFMKELHNLNPDVVQLTTGVPQGDIGHTTQVFPQDSPDKHLVGYDLNPWKMICTSLVDKLKKHSATPDQALKVMNDDIDFASRELFVQEFNARAAKVGLQYSIDLNADDKFTMKVVRTASD